MAGDTNSTEGSGEMSAESVVRAYWQQVWLERDLDALEHVVTDPMVRHTAEGTLSLTRRELRRRLAIAFKTLRVAEVNIHGMSADGDAVWIRLTLKGVSLATGAPISLAWIAQYRIEGDRIAELWALHQPGTDWSP